MDRSSSASQSFFRPATALGLVLLLWLAGCTVVPPRQETVLYRPGADRTADHPVIVIPGTFGSRLNHRTNGRNVWPDSMWTSWMGSNPEALELPLDHRPGEGPPDELRPGRLQDNGLNRHFYDRLTETLTDAGGYECDYPGELTPSTDCVLFTWDWRRDPLATVRRLDELVDRLRRLRARPDLTVDLVAHSAGGLLARYYLRYGARDVLEDPPVPAPMAGSSRVRKALLIAPPNFGSTQALKRALEGQPVGFDTILPETFLRIPGLYPLLPHAGHTWSIDRAGRARSIDLFDTDTWRRHGWSVYDPSVRRRVRERFEDPREGRKHLKKMETFMAVYLERTKRFHRSLTKPAPPSDVIYAVFGGGCRATPDRALIERVDGRHRIRLYPSRITHRRKGVDYGDLMLARGDGSVTRDDLMGVVPGTEKSLFPVDRRVLICQDHDAYTASPTFQDNLLDLLLRK